MKDNKEKKQITYEDKYIPEHFEGRKTMLLLREKKREEEE